MLVGISGAAGALESPVMDPVMELAPGSLASPENLSLFEFGLGLGASFFPHYPGSDQMRVFILPFPYGVYRGSIFRSDREGGTRARFFHSKTFELSLSAGGAFPVDSTNNVAREGMPDLGWMGELGPKLRILLPAGPGQSIRLGLAARGVFASRELPTIEHRGWLIEPEIIFERSNVFMDRFDAFGAASVYFSDRKFASYLYEVTPEQVRPGRPEYRAAGGYFYSTLSAGLSYRSKDERQRFFVYASTDLLQGAANEASPLVKTKFNHVVGVAFLSTLFRSDRKVGPETD
jgi:MipA family protein